VRGFLDLKNVINISYDKTLIPRIYYDYYKYKGKYPYEQSTLSDYNEVEMLGAEVQFLWDIMPNYRITTGTEYRHSLNSEYKVWYEHDKTLSFNMMNDEFSIYFLNEYNPFDFMSIYVGIRYDDYFNIDSRISPRISLLFYPAKSHVFKFIYGQSFRIPTQYEKYYYDSLSNFKQSDGLKSEYISTNEIIYEYQLNTDTKLSLSIYYNEITNLINIVTDPIDSLDYFKNSDTYKGMGGSFDINTKINKAISIYSNYSYQKMHPENNNNLVNSPQHLFKFGLIYHILLNFSTSFEYRYESSRKAYNMAETPEIHYGNLNLIYEPISDITISLSGRNIFNSTIKSPVGSENLQAMVPNPGRTFFIKLAWGL
jgi:iron complex outermembrane receptor protein